MSKHHVKIHKWHRGHLEVAVHQFDHLDTAVTFAANQHRQFEKSIDLFDVEQVIKIYDSETQELITNFGFSTLDTYA